MREALAVLADLPLHIPVSMRQLMPASARLAHDLDHPVYDCFYLALAIQQNSPLLNADRRFQAKVRAHPYLGDRVLHLREA